MAKVNLDDITNIFLAVNTINANSAKIEAAMEKTLSRDGTAPNEMNTHLDMNNHRVYNMAAPVSPSDAVRLQDIQEVLNDLEELEETLQEAKDAAVTSVAGAASSSNSAANSAASAQAAEDAKEEAEAILSGVVASTLRSQIPSRSFAQQVITVGGETAYGDYGAGATYIRGDSNGLRAIQDVSGTWWNLSYEEEVYVGHFGVVGDGVANDTVALQLAFDTATISGHVLNFGKRVICLTDGVVIKDTETPGWTRDRPILRVNGHYSTVKKRSSANNSFVIAPERWFTNVPYPQVPIELTNLCIDAANIANYALVDVYYFAKFQGVECCRAVLDGLFAPTHTADGTVLLGGSVENHYLSMNLHSNGRHGIFIDEGVARTDWFLHDCLIANNGPLYANLKNCAGASIKNNHGYNVTSWGIVNGGVYLASTFGTSVIGNIWEGDLLDSTKVCATIVGSAPSLTLIGNSFYNGRVDAAFSVGCEQINFVGNTFLGGSELWHTYDSPSRIVCSTNDVFESATPYKFGAGSGHTGRLIASNVRSTSLDIIIDGEQYPGTLGQNHREGITSVTPSTTVNMTDSWRETALVVAALTGDCTINLLAGVGYGRKIRVVRPGYATGVFNVVISFSATPIKNLTAAGQWADFQFTGSVWIETASGSL